MARKAPAAPPDRARLLVVRVQLATRAGRPPSAARLAGWVGYPESRRLNQGFRGKSGPTNVLAFSAGPAPAGGAEVEIGALVICLPLVYREAREQGKKPLDHLAHLVVHGMLHLLGHDHDQEAEARRMEHAEVRILRRLGIGNPYRGRAQVRAPAPRRRKT